MSFLRRILLLALVAPAMQGCVGVSYTGWDLGNSQAQTIGTKLAENVDEDGNRQSWRIFPGDSTEQPRLELSETTVIEIPRIGVTVGSMNQDRANNAGLEPFNGVWVLSATTQLPAGAAGLRKGDVILSVNGNPVPGVPQFSSMIADSAAENPDQPMEIRVLFRNRRDESENGENVLSISPTFVTNEQSQIESFALTRSRGLFDYTGLEIATLPQEFAEPIYGTQSPVHVVSGVVTGSPAYEAGLRAGDRLLSVMDRPADSLSVLNESVLELVRREDPTAPPLDLLNSSASFAPLLSEDDDVVTLMVDGPLGPHTAELGVTLDLDAESDVSIPILFNYEQSRTKHESGLLNFIFTFGYDYERRTYASATRAARESSSLSILPLSLIQRHRRPGNTEWRVLWFISWDA